MSILFYIPTPTPPTEPDNYFNESWWEGAGGVGATWSVDRWVPNIIAGRVWLVPVANSPIGNWRLGYDPVSMDITLDDILGGSSTFEITLVFDNGSDPSVSSVPLSDGQTYDFDLSAGGDSVNSLSVTNDASGEFLSITNIVFHT